MENINVPGYISHMKYSDLFCPTLKEAPQGVEVVSHKLMLRAGMIRQVAAGIYNLLPMGLKIQRKVEAIIRDEMNKAGAQEVLLPMVQPSDLWKETERWETNGKELLRFKDRNERDFCLGPTHEEVITDLIRNEIRSYKELPRTLYQIQTKFRDEIRPRFGLMRGREFVMKDAYSFDINDEGVEKNYRLMSKAYHNIFKRCGLKFRSVEADSGNIGGSMSEEFMVLAESGEDQIVHCQSCNYAANMEKATNRAKTTPVKAGDDCPSCEKGKLQIVRGIEVGHVFKLGTKYSEKMNAKFLDQDGKQKPFVMGCYGIGVGRTFAACIEQNNDDRGIIFPPALAPFDMVIVPVKIKDEAIRQASFDAYTKMQEAGFDVLIDDRDTSFGGKMADADLLGIPVRLVIGDKWIKDGMAEIKARWSAEMNLVKQEEVASHAKTILEKGINDA
jgi:prolyl-tRNA synthetase